MAGKLSGSAIQAGTITSAQMSTQLGDITGELKLRASGISLNVANTAYFGGNIGVGTTNPISKFHVSSGTSGNCIFIIEADTDNDNENDNPKIWFKADGGINEAAIQKGDNTLDIISNVNSGGGIRFLTGVETNTGTTDPITNANERLRITDIGNIGIGITNPTNSALHIRADWVSGHSTVKIQTVTPGGATGIGTYDSDGTRSGYVISEGNTTFRAGSTTNIPFIFDQGGNERARIHTNGYFGIGVTPEYPLHIRRAGGACSLGMTFDNYGADPNLARSSFYYAIADSTSDKTAHLFFTRNGTATDNLRLVINAPGQVGIGTVAPSTHSKLHVYGTTGAISSPGLLYSENTDDASALYIKNAGTTAQYDRAVFEAYVGSNEVFKVLNGGAVTAARNPKFHAVGVGGGTYASGSFWIFPTAEVNAGSHYNTSNGRFTAPVTATYIFYWSFIGGSDDTVYRFFLTKNGTITGTDNNNVTRMDETNAGGNYGTNTSRVYMLALTAGDYVQIKFSSDNGSSAHPASNSATDSYANFGGYLLG